MTIDKLNHAKAIAAEIDMLDEQMRRLGSLLRNEENGAMLSLTLVKKGITLCSVRIDMLPPYATPCTLLPAGAHGCFTPPGHAAALTQPRAGLC